MSAIALSARPLPPSRPQSKNAMSRSTSPPPSGWKSRYRCCLSTSSRSYCTPDELLVHAGAITAPVAMTETIYMRTMLRRVEIILRRYRCHLQGSASVRGKSSCFTVSLRVLQPIHLRVNRGAGPAAMDTASMGSVARCARPPCSGFMNPADTAPSIKSNSEAKKL